MLGEQGKALLTEMNCFMRNVKGTGGGSHRARRAQEVTGDVHLTRAHFYAPAIDPRAAPGRCRHMRRAHRADVTALDYIYTGGMKAMYQYRYFSSRYIPRLIVP